MDRTGIEITEGVLNHIRESAVHSGESCGGDYGRGLSEAFTIVTAAQSC